MQVFTEKRGALPWQVPPGSNPYGVASLAGHSVWKVAWCSAGVYFFDVRREPAHKMLEYSN